MNSILIFTYPLGIVLVLALVIGLGIFLTRKYNLGWRLYWIGGALFIISQILHIPFNIFLQQLFVRGFLPLPPDEYQLLFSAILVGLSAGLFEEITRYVGLRWWAKDARAMSDCAGGQKMPGPGEKGSCLALGGAGWKRSSFSWWSCC